MAESDWRTVVAGLERLSTEPTADQLAIATALGMPMALGTPEPVAAAILMRRLRSALKVPAARAFGESEYEYLADLAKGAGLLIPTEEEIVDRNELDAWITVARARQSINHLSRLALETGDVVVVNDTHFGGERVGIVSSIGASGRLYFKGGRGGGTWPQFVRRVVRPADAGHHDACRLAIEHAAARNKTPQHVSRADLERLEGFKVELPPPLAAREALVDVLNTATEERPPQVVLEQHPSLLAHMTAGNHGTWVIPQVRFGDRYVADFLIAAETSAGLKWTLVELESPEQRLTNKGNGRVSQALRHALDQIGDWRHWLEFNIGYARMPRTDGGLGLAGITVETQGLIIIGRDGRGEDTRRLTLELQRYSRIEVRTYDWLMRAASAVTASGWGVLESELIAKYGDDIGP